MIAVLRSGALNTVQDLGRPQGLRWGVGRSGAMDCVSLQIANLLVANRRDEATIEIAIFPFEIRFEADCAFAVAGSGLARLDGEPLPSAFARRARAGQVLAIEPTRNGVFGYLALGGGLEAPVMHGSRSTDLKARFGGVGGAALSAGVRVALRAPDAGEVVPERGYGAAPSALPAGASPVGGGGELRIIRAAEWDVFTDASREGLVEGAWSVSREMNRTGYMLTGPMLETRTRIELHSHGIVPGIIQVPPSGQAIVQMADANTCGGYPKIATVIPADLWRLAQTRSGEPLRFREIDWTQGVKAEQVLDRALVELDSFLSDARERLA